MLMWTKIGNDDSPWCHRSPPSAHGVGWRGAAGLARILDLPFTLGAFAAGIIDGGSVSG
jgi:hypothetical protein